jgi:hypothetical protein
MDIQELVHEHWPDLTVKENLGHGTGGTVYKVLRFAEQKEEVYALKYISVPKNPMEISVLYQEHRTEEEIEAYCEEKVSECRERIKMLYELRSSSHIVRILDHYVKKEPLRDQWHIMILMEYLTPVPAFLDSRTAEESFVRKLGIDLCHALIDCGEKGILHRDIKPDNIFLTKDGNFKLGDFGISRFLPEDLSDLSRKGTPAYIAPEVIQGKPYTFKADQYSLGIVLYTLLNQSCLPFLDQKKLLLTPAERESAIQRRLGGEALPPPSEASEAVGEVILRACQSDPARRFESVPDFLFALQDPEAYRNRDLKKGTASSGAHVKKILLFMAAGLILPAGLLWGLTHAAGPDAREKKTVDPHGEKSTESKEEGIDASADGSSMDGGLSGEDAIEWTNPYIMEKACAWYSKKAGTPVTPEEAAEITELYLDQKELGDISDLKWFSGLKVLYLKGSSAKNFARIGDLYGLEELNLSDTDIRDISFLSECSHMKRLFLAHTHVSDLPELEKMKYLENLDISYTEVDELSDVQKCRSLKRLDLSGLSIRDVSALAKLTGLDELRVRDIPEAELNEILLLDLEGCDIDTGGETISGGLSPDR